MNTIKRIGHNTFIIIILSTLLLSSCMKDDDVIKPQPVNIPNHLLGVFVINEGNFTYDNASLSFYNADTKKILNNIFYETNAVPLGDVAQSISIKDSLAYIVINNSGKIYVINTKTFQLQGKITGLTSPRYIHFVNYNKAYVSDLYSKKITIIDPISFSKIGEINVNNPKSEFQQHPTEQFVQYKDWVFTNCWSYDNKILVINSKTDKVIDSLEVGIQPNSMVIDKNNHIWVLSDGGYEGSPYSGKACLTEVDAQSRKILQQIYFKDEDSPSELQINSSKDTLYFINKDIYRLSITENQPKMIIESPHKNLVFGGFYGLGISPTNSDIYVADAIDFQQNGIIYRYSSSITPIDTFEVGIIPSAFGFLSL